MGKTYSLTWNIVFDVGALANSRKLVVNSPIRSWLQQQNNTVFKVYYKIRVNIWTRNVTIRKKSIKCDKNIQTRHYNKYY